jgi:hypothetical protein
MPLFSRLAAQPLWRVGPPSSSPSPSFLCRRLPPAIVSCTCVASRRSYTTGAEPVPAAQRSHVGPSPCDTDALRHVPSHAFLDAPPSPVEVHQVIARAVQHGRWKHAVRLLLGALQSHCVPLAETYQLVLLAALRGGGWQASVELMEQVATSPLSATALYHTAADMLLYQLGQATHGCSEALASIVVDELVPLMLADATRYVAWKPRHREGVLRVLAEMRHPELISQLFQRWTATMSATASQPSAAHTFSMCEASLLMSAFANAGDWRSAEALRVRLPATAPDNILVDFVRAFTTALKGGGAAQASLQSRSQLVPWEVAIDVAARHHGCSALTAAVAQLKYAAHQSMVPNDVARWWWSVETTVHAKLTELRRRCAKSLKEASELLSQCHVSTAGVAELLGAVSESGVLSSGDGDWPLYRMQWLSVVVVLGRYCPAALVSPLSGYSDGFACLLPYPQWRVSRLTDSSTPSMLSSTSHYTDEDGSIPLWRYVATHMLEESTSSIRGGDATRCVLTLAATLHYLLYALAAASASVESADSALQAISQALQDSCTRWTQQLQQQSSSVGAGDHTERQASALTLGCDDAIAVYLRTVSTFMIVPSFEQAVHNVLGDATAVDAVVVTAVVACLRPLEQLLGSTAALCGVACAAFTDAPSTLPPQAAYALVLYVAAPLRDGVSIVTQRPLLRQVETLLSAASDADTLLLLCAQLQWCWGGSLEGLRVRGIPILQRRQCWRALARVLDRCPTPLSSQEQRAVAMCTEGQRLEQLQELVAADDVTHAWELWTELRSGDGASELALPLTLHTALVSLLVEHHRTKDACEVLAVEPAAAVASSSASWSLLGLRVCRHVLHSTEGVVTLADLWAVTQVEERKGRADVVKREATLGLAMYAAATLSFAHRDAEAFDLLRDAVAFVTHYDAAHHHHRRQQGPGAASAQGGMNAGFGGCEDELDSPPVLRNTDAQLCDVVPLCIQCAMPPVLLSAMARAATLSAHHTDDDHSTTTVLRVTRHILLLTSNTADTIGAWAALLPHLSSLAGKAVGTADALSPSDGAAFAVVVALARGLLYRATELRAAVPPTVVRLVVTGIRDKAFPPNSTAALVDRVHLALCEQRDGGGIEAAANGPSVVPTMAAQVAGVLASEGNYTQALQWVSDFCLWSAAGDTRIPAGTLWWWIEASCAAHKRHADTRAALRQRYTDVFTKSDACGEATAQLFSLTSLDALVECGAWENTFRCYLSVVLEPKFALCNVRSTTAPGDFAHISDATMEMAALRDSYLAPDVLRRVMQSLAEHAPWRACMQAWMLLCAQLPLLSWGAHADAVAPALQQLFLAMQRQEAPPHEVGTVLVWVVAQLNPPVAALSPLVCTYANAIAVAPAWTRADGEQCAERLQQLRRLLGEQRVREVAQAIAEAEAALALSAHLQSSLSSSRVSSSNDADTVSAATWLPPGRPSLSASEVDALAVVAPLLLLASAPQLEMLAQRHLNARFRGYELKALLWFYRDELLQRVAAAQPATDGDAALVTYLAENTTLHVYASQACMRDASDANTDAAAARWLADVVFDGLLPCHLASQLWAACRTPAATLAACRWSPVVEAELRAELLRRHGKPPTRLRTAPHVSRKVIAHYWSCFHRVLAPELHFGPVELCCLAAYTPALMRLRAQHPNSSTEDYALAIRGLAGPVHHAHFSPSRVPAEDTLAYLRRPRTPAAIAAVMTMAFKKLKVLHAQLFEGTSATAEQEVAHALPAHLRRHFAACAAATPSPEATVMPAHLQQASLAAAVRRLTGAPDVHLTTPASLNFSSRKAPNTSTTPPAMSDLVDVTQRHLSSPLLRSWVSWVITECAAPRQPIPPSASLLLVEWVKEALCTPHSALGTAEGGSNVTGSSSDLQLQWTAVEGAGHRELQQRTCQELSCAWQILSDADAWPLMSVGHRVALEKMVSPSPAQVKKLPLKKRRPTRTDCPGVK